MNNWNAFFYLHVAKIDPSLYWSPIGAQLVSTSYFVNGCASTSQLLATSSNAQKQPWLFLWIRCSKFLHIQKASIHTSIDCSKPLSPLSTSGSNVALGLTAISAGQTRTSTNQMVPALATLMVCTHYEYEIRSLCAPLSLIDCWIKIFWHC